MAVVWLSAPFGCVGKDVPDSTHLIRVTSHGSTVYITKASDLIFRIGFFGGLAMGAVLWCAVFFVQPNLFEADRSP